MKLLHLFANDFIVDIGNRNGIKFKLFFKSMASEGPNLIQKKNITSEDIKEIVLLLNEPPFQENMTLVGLDELSTFELGDLVFKIFKHLNSDINLNAKQTAPAEIIYQVTEFLRVLSYECEFGSDWENGLLNGDRKIIYPIYYFLLKNLSALRKRAYLAKFMVPIEVPQQFSGDPEIKQLNEKLKQLQVEFQVTHEEFQAIESSSLNPAELKKQITKLEQQKEQLSSRINTMKSKHGSKPELAPMLQATTMLRKEQQIEDTLIRKIQSHRSQLEGAESQLMSLQQSLVDAKKSLSPNNSPEQMVQALKNQVRKNREIVRERMTVEYNQRLKKLQQTQKLLSEPPITQNQLMMLENTMAGLRRTVSQMEEKLSKETSKDDKLAIYKGQAALVTKKKEQTQQSLKRQEEDMSRLETEIRKKEEQINKLKGAGFKKNKLEDYINQIKEKRVKYAKSKAEIQEIKWEKNKLERTLEILKDQKARYEKTYDLIGGEKVMAESNLENASMEEINRQIDKLLEQIKRKRAELGPKVEEKKNVLSEFEKVENQYKNKKVSFLGTTNKIEDDIKDIEEKIAKVRVEVYGIDTRIQLNKFKNEIIDLKVDRLTEEANNQKGSGKGFMGAKSYQDYVKDKASSNEKELGALSSERQKIADQHMPSMQQKRMFADLKKLLVCKLQASGESQSVNRGQKLGNNVNVLQIG